MMLKWLLTFVPIAIALEYLTPQRHLLIFVTAAIAILPLAAWLGRATEQLANRSGEGVGGFLNATFGNAAELIIDDQGHDRRVDRGKDPVGARSSYACRWHAP